MHKSFYFLWSSISLGKLGLSLYTMTMTIVVLSRTGSATKASLVMLMHLLGKVASTFIFPLATERFPLQRLLSAFIFIQMLIILCVLLTVNWIVNETSLYWILYILIVLVGCTDGFISPSRQALVPELVSNRKIAKANSFISSTDQSLALIGWSLGAVIVNYYGYFFVLTLTICLLFVSLCSSFQIKSLKFKVVDQRPKISLMLEGWSYLFLTSQNMRVITFMDLLEGIASGIWIGGISLVFVIEVLEKDESWWGYINTAYYAGSIIGGVMIALYSRILEKHLIKGMVIGSFTVSILILFYSINQTAWLALGFVLIMGPFYQLRDISQQTYIQKVTPNIVLSKMYAAKDNLYYLVFTFSVLITGFIADFIGIVYVYFMAFLLYFISGLFALISFKNLKRNNLEKENLLKDRLDTNQF